VAGGIIGGQLMAAADAKTLAMCVRNAVETAMPFYDWLNSELKKASLVGRADDCSHCPIAVFLKDFLRKSGYELPFVCVTSDIISVRVGEMVCELPTPPWVTRFETMLLEQCERDHRQWATPRTAMDVLEQSLLRCDFAARG
jgi:hypothetical protein